MQVVNDELVVTKPKLIYNPNNILLEKKTVHSVLAKADIHNKVNNLAIWQSAFIHNSYSKKVKRNQKYTGFIDQIDDTTMSEIDVNKCLPVQEESNESLEWLGDSILQAVTGVYLDQRYPEQDEGFKTKLRSRLVKTETLAKFAKQYEFDKYVIISRHLEENCNGRNMAHILEDVFEAFIGAIVRDFGAKDRGKAYNLCEKFIVHTFETYVDFADMIMNDDNYKDQLMRFYQKKFDGKFPVYEVEEHDEEEKSFTMIVRHPLTNMVVGRGKAKNKKQGEQLAAKYAIGFFDKST